MRGAPARTTGRGGPTRVQNSGAVPAERAQGVERAASRIGERLYSLSGNNCEHFANWCASGVAISYQVIAFFALLRMVFLAVCSLLAVCVTRVAFAE